MLCSYALNVFEEKLNEFNVDDDRINPMGNFQAQQQILI